MQFRQIIALPLLSNALELGPPEDYFKGRSSADVCIPSNLILFSRRTSQELQRRSSFDAYPAPPVRTRLQSHDEGSVGWTASNGVSNPSKDSSSFPTVPLLFGALDPNIVWLILTFELQNPVVMESFRNRIIDLDASTIEQLNDILEDYQGKTLLGPIVVSF